MAVKTARRTYLNGILCSNYDLLFVEYVIEIVVVVVVVYVVEVVEIVKPNAGSVVEVLCKLLHFLKKVIRSGQVSSVSGFLTCKIQEKTFFKSY